MGKNKNRTRNKNKNKPQKNNSPNKPNKPNNTTKTKVNINSVNKNTPSKTQPKAKTSKQYNKSSEISDKTITENLPPQKTSNYKKRIFFVIALLVLLGSGACIQTENKEHLVYKNTNINNVDVSNTPLSEISSVVKKLSNEYLEKNSFKFLNGEEVVEFNLKDIGYTIDSDALADSIITGNNKNILIRTLDRVQTLVLGKDITLNPTISNEDFDSFKTKLEDLLTTTAAEPKIEFKDSIISSDNGIHGASVDLSNLEELLDTVIQNDSFATTISLQTIHTNPKLSKETVSKMTKLSSFRTKVPTLSGGRTKNIKLYMDKLDKTVIFPNEIFSADTQGGSRTAKDGYSPAPAFVNGEVKNILAGGICQGTSTLYNALVFADLDIVERHPHSMPVTYLPIGRDAAIANGQKDLRFKNNYKNPVILHTYLDSNGYVTAEVWGISETPNKEIKLRTVNHHSKSSTTYKQTLIDGKVIEDKKIHSDTYK